MSQESNPDTPDGALPPHPSPSSVYLGWFSETTPELRDAVSKHLVNLRIARENYNRQTTRPCPRCGSPELGLPFCTDVGFYCGETCGCYRWADEVCGSCEREMASAASSRISSSLAALDGSGGGE